MKILLGMDDGVLIAQLIFSSIGALDFQMLDGPSVCLSTLLIFIHLYADPVISAGQIDCLVK